MPAMPLATSPRSMLPLPGSRYACMVEEVPSVSTVRACAHAGPRRTQDRPWTPQLAVHPPGVALPAAEEEAEDTPDHAVDGVHERVHDAPDHVVDAVDHRVAMGRTPT